MNFQEAVEMIAEKAKNEGVKFVISYDGRIVTERDRKECPLMFLTGNRADYDVAAARDFRIGFGMSNRIMEAADRDYPISSERAAMEAILVRVEKEC